MPRLRGCGGGVLQGVMLMVQGFFGKAAPLWTSCFMLLFAIAAVNLLRMHSAIRHQERAAAPELVDFRFLPELRATSELGGKQP
jgi:MFS transporter, NNP family, nitrate/nitrite transporter